MSIARNLTPQSLSTSNILLLVSRIAIQMEDADSELAAVALDRNIATARADTLADNWGAILEVAFDQSFTLERYRGILAGVVKARRKAPTKGALREMVAAFAPSASVEIHDYFRTPGSFVGPDPSTFFTLNGTGPGNVWNSQSAVLAPGRLLRLLGFTDFGTQVQVTAVADPADIQALRFVPPALEFVRPAHQFVALVFDNDLVI